jgi:hypothetical protein
MCTILWGRLHFVYDVTLFFFVHSPTSGYCVLSHIPMVWRHVEVVRQRASRATSCHSFITTVWWYNILYQTPFIRQATCVNFKGKRIHIMLDKCIIFTGWHHKHYCINKTITVFCISEYEFLLTWKTNIGLILRLWSISFYRSIKALIDF